MKVDKYNAPFKVQVLDTEPVKVTNRFGGDSVMLEPLAVAVYDTIMGAELIGEYGEMQKGMQWFRKYYPAEYMTLLD